MLAQEWPQASNLGPQRHLGINLNLPFQDASSRTPALSRAGGAIPRGSVPLLARSLASLVETRGFGMTPSSGISLRFEG